MHGQNRPRISFWFILGLLLLCALACLSPGAHATSPPRTGDCLSIESACFSPISGDVFISINGETHGGIYVMDRNGKIKKSLLPDTERTYYRSPALSFDGRKIAFISNRYGLRPEILLRDVAGGETRRLTSSTGFDRYPSFSRDGKRIYFIRAWKGRFHKPSARPERHADDLCYVDLGSGETHRIIHGLYYNYRMRNPREMPNGDEVLLFWPRRLTFNSVVVVNVANKISRWPIRPNMEKYLAYQEANPSFTRKLSYENLQHPVLSRDGRTLAFVWSGYIERTGDQIYFCDMASMEAKPITHGKGTKVPCDISPHNQQVLFISNAPPEPVPAGKYPTNLWIVNQDGTGPRNLSLDFSAVAEP